MVMGWLLEWGLVLYLQHREATNQLEEFTQTNMGYVMTHPHLMPGSETSESGGIKSVLYSSPESGVDVLVSDHAPFGTPSTGDSITVFMHTPDNRMALFEYTVLGVGPLVLGFDPEYASQHPDGRFSFAQEAVDRDRVERFFANLRLAIQNSMLATPASHGRPY